MKKLSTLLLIVLLTFSNMNKILAQSQNSKLNQIELIKQFLGTWKGEFANNTMFICENKQFGNGIVSNSEITSEGKIIDSIVQVYGYDSKTDKFIIAELKESSPEIELCSIWFSSENEGQIVITNPENAPLKFEFEFKNPDLIEQIAIQDNKIVSKIVLKRIER
jgi:hypothetical protein